MDRKRRSIGTVRHQRHHSRPDTARGMIQTGMEAQRIGRRKMYPARREISLDRRPLCRLGGLPDGERDLAGPGVVEIACAMRC